MIVFDIRNDIIQIQIHVYSYILNIKYFSKKMKKEILLKYKYNVQSFRPYQRFYLKIEGMEWNQLLSSEVAPGGHESKATLHFIKSIEKYIIKDDIRFKWLKPSLENYIKSQQISIISSKLLNFI